MVVGVAVSSCLGGRLADVVDALVAAAINVRLAQALGLDLSEDEEEAEDESEGTEDDGVHLQGTRAERKWEQNKSTKKKRKRKRATCLKGRPS